MPPLRTVVRTGVSAWIASGGALARQIGHFSGGYMRRFVKQSEHTLWVQPVWCCSVVSDECNKHTGQSVSDDMGYTTMRFIVYNTHVLNEPSVRCCRMMSSGQRIASHMRLAALAS